MNLDSKVIGEISWLDLDADTTYLVWRSLTAHTSTHSITRQRPIPDHEDEIERQLDSMLKALHEDDRPGAAWGWGILIHQYGDALDEIWEQNHG